jgi:hypothetical protein
MFPHIVDTTADSFLRYIDYKCGDLIDEDCGCLDFSRFPAYELYANESCFYGIIHTTAEIDRCPLFEFDLSGDEEPRHTGNFRTYTNRIANLLLVVISLGRIQVDQVIMKDTRILLWEIAELTRDLRSFSVDCVVPSGGLTKECFVNTSAELRDKIDDDYLTSFIKRHARGYDSTHSFRSIVNCSDF